MTLYGRHALMRDLRFAYRVGALNDFVMVIYIAVMAVTVAELFNSANNLTVTTVTLAILSMIGMLLMSEGLVNTVRHARRLQLPNWRHLIFRAQVLLISAWLVIPCGLLIVLSHSWTAVLMVSGCGLFGMLVPLALFSQPIALGANLKTILLLASVSVLAAYFIRFAYAHQLQPTLWLLPPVLLLIALIIWRWHTEFTAPPVRVSNAHIDTFANEPVALPATNMCLARWLQKATPRFSLRSFRRTPSAIIRVFLGKPYASTSVRHRLIHVGLIVSLLLVAPVILFVFGSDHSWQAALHAWRFMWLPLVLVTDIAIWTIFLFAIVKIFVQPNNVSGELAILPKLGNATAQLRGLVWALLGLPVLIHLTITAIALLSPWCLRAQSSLLWVVGIYSLYILGVCASAALLVVAWISPPEGCVRYIRSLRWQPLLSCFLIPTAYQLSQHDELVIYVIGSGASPWLIAAIVALFTFPVTVSGIAIRKLTRRPHPFVEVT